MTRFTVPRVAHCAEGCKHSSWVRCKTAHLFFLYIIVRAWFIV